MVRFLNFGWGWKNNRLIVGLHCVCKFVRIIMQVKILDYVVSRFTNLLSNSPKCSPWFSPGYEGTENMFYFLNVLTDISSKDFIALIFFNWTKKRKFDINHYTVLLTKYDKHGTELLVNLLCMLNSFSITIQD